LAQVGPWRAAAATFEQAGTRPSPRPVARSGATVMLHRLNSRIAKAEVSVRAGERAAALLRAFEQQEIAEATEGIRQLMECPAAYTLLVMASERMHNWGDGNVGVDAWLDADPIGRTMVDEVQRIYQEFRAEKAGTGTSSEV
jgi:hypothetical protein